MLRTPESESAQQSSDHHESRHEQFFPAEAASRAADPARREMDERLFRSGTVLFPVVCNPITWQAEGRKSRWGMIKIVPDAPKVSRERSPISNQTCRC